jgi:hypothetical protein
MYVSDGRLAVVAMDWQPLWDVMPLAVDGLWNRPTCGAPELSLEIFDVSVPTEPQLVREIHVEGSLVDSRMIGDTMLLVTQSNFYLPAPEIVPADGTDSDAPSADDPALARLVGPAVGLPWCWIEHSPAKFVYETEEQYFARIGDQVLDLALPNYTVFGPDGVEVSTGLWTAPDHVYQPLDATHDSLVSIAAIKISGDEPGLVTSTSAPIDWTSELYASLSSVYVVSPEWNVDGALSSIAQFAVDLGAATIDLAATGQVPGTLLNQFALDECGDHLRVVTQVGWRNTAETNLYVLAQNGDQLEIVGTLEDLTPGEQLYSVRFMGDVAYAVTFGPDSGVWYDPLLTIDLSDPTQPQLAGQLEIPGFSNYLQQIDEGHVIGLGRNADETNGRPLEPQVSLYDVSDLTAPQLTDRVPFGNATSWSDAFFDHHAISYFPEYQVLAIPLNTYLPVMEPFGAAGEDPASPLPRDQMALWVFQIVVDPESSDVGSIKLLGTIEHPDAVLRSLRIEDRLYSLSHDWVQVHSILDPAAGLDRLFIGQAVQPDWFEVQMGSQDNPLDVLANDQLPPGSEGQPVILGVSEASAGGSVTIASDGRSLLYTPPDRFRGVDTFTYTIADGAGVSDETLVTVCVLGTDAGQRMAELARDALAQELSVPADEIAVVSIEDVDWPDTSLGVPEPGMAYLDVVVPGFRVVLQHDAAQYEYHTDAVDRVVLAEQWPIWPDDPVTGQPPEPEVQLRLEAVDASGQPVEVVEVGDSFELRVYVQDLRAEPQGVTAAYADVLFRDRLVSLAGSIAFGPDYSSETSGDVSSPGLVDELGGRAEAAAADGQEHLVATIPFTASRPGIVRFVLNPADDANHVVWVAGDEEAVSEEAIQYLGTRIAIAGWQNVEWPCDVNDDGDTTPVDALHIINDINLYGVRRLEHLAAQATELAAAAHDFLDVNGDGVLSANDVLVIINDLNGNTEPTTGDQTLPPLASLVDWGAIQEALQSDTWAAPLESLNLTPSQTLDLAHEVLVSVDQEWLQNHFPAGLDLARLQRAVLHDGGEQVTQLLTDMGPQLESADALAAIQAAIAELDGLTPDQACAQVLRDRIFGELADGTGWLSRLTG